MAGAQDQLGANDAIVYVPGLQLGLSDQRTFLGVTQRIALACDRQADSRAVRWSLETRLESLGADHEHVQTTTVFAESDDTRVPVVDIYEFAWARELTSRWEAQGTRTKLVRGIVGFWYGARLCFFLMVAAARERTGRRLFQALLALLALLVVVAYVITLVGAAVTVILQWADVTGDSDWRWLQQATVVLTVVISAVVPALRGRIPALGATLLAVSDYVRLPPESQRITGELTSFIEAIEEQGRHERLHVVAYSMGSVIAFDTFFASTSAPVKSLEGVDTLVTIGPPFATVRATRGNYFDGRKAGKPPARWITYWSTADLLSSERPISRKRQQIDFGGDRPSVRSYDLPVDLRLPNMIAFYGFASHAMYWGPDGERDRNVFDVIVAELGLPGSPGSGSHTSDDAGAARAGGN